MLGCPWKLVTIVSMLGYNLFRGLTSYLYWGYNLVTKYHGHPSGGEKTGSFPQKSPDEKKCDNKTELGRS